MQRGERNQTSKGLTLLQVENQIMDENHRSNVYSFSSVEKNNLSHYCHIHMHRHCESQAYSCVLFRAFRFGGTAQVFIILWTRQKQSDTIIFGLSQGANSFFFSVS